MSITERAMASSVMCSATATRSSGEAKRTPCKHAVGLGEKVLASVGGMVLGDRGDDRLGGIGEDRLAEVVAAKQRQVVAVLQARDPGDLLVLCDVACGPFRARFR